MESSRRESCSCGFPLLPPTSAAWILSAIPRHLGSGHVEAGMNRLRFAGILWIFAALISIAIALIFRIDPLQIAVTLAAGAVAAVLGAWMLAHQSSSVISASMISGAVWVVLYAVLTLLQAGELVAWTTDVFLGILGVAAAVIAYRAGGRTSPRLPIP